MAKAIVRMGEGTKTVIRVREFEIIADETIEDGGTNQGMGAQELLIAALGACAAITSRIYARRKGWALEGVEIDVSGERYKVEDYPVYNGTEPFVHEFRQRIHFIGDLTAEQKERLREIAGKCPVHRALTEPKIMIEELVDSIIAEES